ncbi:hypothetical protein ASD81_04265 [Nocardioides sp. Root614]|nr:hypothetical protein ASD81_04265 [Nocardioides sp. Root614]KRA91865.1 hypothetical protein ASD84_04530 [Nocardioides sp. Root682]
MPAETDEFVGVVLRETVIDDVEECLADLDLEGRGRLPYGRQRTMPTSGATRSVLDPGAPH